MSAILFDQLITADVPAYEIIAVPSPQQGRFVLDFVVKIETVTPGIGSILVTLDYSDEETVQTLNVALSPLSAGNYTVQAWPDLWYIDDTAVHVTVSYLGGIVNGTAQVTVFCRNN